jgi:hypothetical protein
VAPNDALPAAIERLIDDLSSVGTVELLVLLREASPDARSVDEICSALRCPPTWADLQLRRLDDADLIAADADGAFSYAPRSGAHAETVDELARLWRADRRAITSRMLASPRARRRARFGMR